MRRTVIGAWAAGPGAILAAAALWGTVGPAQVLAGPGLGPSAVGGWRLLVGGGVLGAWCLRRRGALRGLRGPDAWPWVLVAALATAVFQAAFLASVDHLGAALATAVALGTAPAATGVLATVVVGERLGRRWAAGAGTAVVGCVVLLGPQGGSGVGAAGLALGVLAGGCYGAYTVAAKRLSRADVDPIAAVAATLLLGGALLLPAVLADRAPTADGSTVLLVAWLALGATAVAYALFVRGLRTTDASAAGVLSLVEPLVAAVLGIVVLGEGLSAAEAGGGALLLAGVVITALPSPARRPRVAARGEPNGPRSESALGSSAPNSL
ncbi:DMT family transporter [Patulibacter sp. NPDC049589]|uniref:DMT family transporter n=1 Tax=Patulibacter sp. NPDC049589 TaxID=3154731 RepID=UPI0034479980